MIGYEIIFFSLIALGGSATALISKDELFWKLFFLILIVVAGFVASWLSHWSILLISAVPLGLLVSHMAEDEIRMGKKWFEYIMIASFLLGILLYSINDYSSTLAFAFIFIFCSISLIGAKREKREKSKI